MDQNETVLSSSADSLAEIWSTPNTLFLLLKLPTAAEAIVKIHQKMAQISLVLTIMGLFD